MGVKNQSISWILAETKTAAVAAAADRIAAAVVAGAVGKTAAVAVRGAGTRMPVAGLPAAADATHAGVDSERVA